VKDRIYKLVRNSAGMFRQTLSRDARLLIFFLEPFSGEVEVCWPLNNVPELTEPTQVLVKSCLKRERSVLVHDSKVDPLIGSVEGADFRAALCVPLLDKVGNPMGVIYADAEKVGALEKQERLEMERLARTLSRRIPKWTPADVGPKKNEEEKSRLNPTVLPAVLGVLLFFSLAWIFAPSTPGEKRAAQATASPTPEREKMPEDTVRAFATLVRLREYSQAYNLLSEQLKVRLTEEEFKAQISGWMADETNRWRFQRREIGKADVTGEIADVKITPGADDDSVELWTYSLSKEDGDWRLLSFQGGGPLKISKE